MCRLIADELLDNIHIKPDEVDGSSRLVKIKGLPESLVLISSLGFFSLSEILYVVSGVLDRQGVGINGTGFCYPTDELDPGEEPFEGVKIYNPLGEVQVNISAFERLMVRYFRALIVEVERRKLPMLQQSTWSSFISVTERLEERTLNSE